ncbi:hypothetical protein BX616_000103, partial [Lobosporangium transversale]
MSKQLCSPPPPEEATDIAPPPPAPPPFPPPPPEISDILPPSPPPPPPSGPDGLKEVEPNVETEVLSNIKTSEALVDPPRRKRRFSPPDQDSCSINSTDHNNPLKDKEAHSGGYHKADMPSLSSKPKSERSMGPGSIQKTIPIPPLSANRWEKTAFVGDKSGEKRIKFLRLMGLGKTTAIEAKPECPEEA